MKRLLQKHALKLLGASGCAAGTVYYAAAEETPRYPVSVAQCDVWNTRERTRSRTSTAKADTKPIECRDGSKVFPWSAPSREAQLESLREEVFDVLVIGGGCVGSGVALDAATRGLTVAMVDRDDFAAGTSGRSTKLIHGGVRYLQNAILKLDIGQYRLVKEALAERSHMLSAAPYIAQAQPIMLPLEKWWQVPFMWVGLKVYDFIAGKHLAVPASMFINKAQALYSFPMMKPDIYGAIVYYDGQMNDTRYNLLIALTAAQAGATVANHVNIDELIYSEKQQKFVGAWATDKVTNQRVKIRAKTIINCTGPFTDSIRKMAAVAASPNGESLQESASTEDIVIPAGGVHVVLPDHFSPANMGLIVPETRDGRVLFFLPWEGGTLCGTTDSESPLTMLPRPTMEEVDFILGESSRYLNRRVRRQDVRAAWCGIRPLVRDPSAHDTKSISREHVIEVNPGGMVTCAGGKWTTYRQMAEDAVDKILALNGSLKALAGPCVTKNMKLIGADRARIVCDQSFDIITITLREDYGFDRDIAEHLTRNYGTRALQIAEIVRAGYPGRKPGLHPKRLVAKHPILEAEIVFAVEQEYARTADDFLARRTRLGYVDQEAAVAAMPHVLDLMGSLLKWSSKEKRQQAKRATEFLETMQINPDASEE